MKVASESDKIEVSIMSDSCERFPAYQALLGLTDKYGGVGVFERDLQQAQEMSANGHDLEEQGVRFSARGRRVYGHAHGAQDFVDATRKSFEAANGGNMRLAETEALIARQYQQTFFNLNNHRFDPRTARRA